MKIGRSKKAPVEVTQDQEQMLASLTAELKRLNKHRFIRMHNSWWRIIFFQFCRGLAFGLGSVIGATALLSVLVYWLAQFEWVPILGDWFAQIADEIDPTRPDE